MKRKTLIVAGGGTGGHFFSGLAVGEFFERRTKGNRAIYVGTRRGIEARMGGGLDVRFVTALPGTGWRSRIMALLVLPLGVLQATLIILKERPVAVVGVGGYASVPTVLAGILLGRITGVVEQNSIPGRANRVLGRLVRRVFVSFPDRAGYFPVSRTLYTGNPVRHDLVSEMIRGQPPAVERKRFHVLVFGGSQGAKTINEALLGALRGMTPEQRSRFHFLHQAGRSEIERVRSEMEALEAPVDVRPFIDDMATAYRSCDLVVCRAGATTIAELAMARRPSILVPYPFAADDHQTANARNLVEAGAAILVEDKHMDGERLRELLLRLQQDREELVRMGRAAGNLARPQAADEIVEELFHLHGGTF